MLQELALKTKNHMNPPQTYAPLKPLVLHVPKFWLRLAPIYSLITCHTIVIKSCSNPQKTRKDLQFQF